MVSEFYVSPMRPGPSSRNGFAAMSQLKLYSSCSILPHATEKVVCPLFHCQNWTCIRRVRSSYIFVYWTNSMTVFLSCLKVIAPSWVENIKETYVIVLKKGFATKGLAFVSLCFYCNFKVWFQQKSDEAHFTKLDVLVLNWNVSFKILATVAHCQVQNLFFV